MGDSGRVPALDGLRGLAVALVFAGHATGRSGPGAAGVALFLVLSGYLITGRLRDGQPLREFWERRARRLLPALALMLTVMGAWWWTVRPETGWELLRAATYTENFGQVAGFRGSPFGHTWSLALEEQFYLAWPLIFLAFRPRVRALWWAAGVGVAAQVVTWVLLDQHAAVVGPAFAPLAAGCALALRPVLGSPALGLCLVGAGAVVPGEVPAFLLASAGAALLIAAPPDFGRVAQWVGVRSYGLYLWHFPLMVGAAMYAAPRWWGGLLAIPIAAASWRWVERPVLTRANDREVVQTQEVARR